MHTEFSTKRLDIFKVNEISCLMVFKRVSMHSCFCTMPGCWPTLDVETGCHITNIRKIVSRYSYHISCLQRRSPWPKIVFFIRICTTIWWWQFQSAETCSTTYNKYMKFIRLAQCYSDTAIDKGFTNTTGWRYLIIVYTHELSYPAFWTDCTSEKTIHFSRINVLIDSNNRSCMNRQPREFDTPNSITGMLHTQIHPTKRDIGHRSHRGSIEWKEFLRTVNVVTILNKDTGRGLGGGVQNPSQEIPKFWQSWTEFPVP
jgi:hypothetical protein